jgi:hypothetical protein
MVMRIVELQVASGRQVRVLRTQTARYDELTRFVLEASSQAFSLDPTGRYALVQCLRFGWMDLSLGRFTSLLLA